MEFSERASRIVVLVACAASLGLGSVAAAQTSAFDSAKAAATAQQIADQVKQIRAQETSTDAAFANDLRELQGHAEHLRSGLGSGLGELATAPVVKRVVDLALASSERASAASASAETLAALAGVQTKVNALEGLYGIDVAAPAPKPPAPTIAQADPCKEKVRLVGVEFEIDSDKITPASAATLGAAVEKLDKCKSTSVAIDGYTDSTGPAKYNRKLSQERADAVKAFLVGKGIAAERLKAKGDGEADPIAPNATIAGGAENRRVELTPGS
jgi:outer membrane protein OmpA-like peptidoglycan-associated protein